MSPVRLLAVVLLVLSTACGGPSQALGRVEAAPPRPSPERRDARNRLDVHYRLNAPATVSSQIVTTDGGARWPIHADVPRPTPGDYVLQFDGTIAGPGPNERQVLPDGDYEVVLDVAAAGRQQEARVPLVIRDADAQPLQITDLALLPERISPNFDARDDVTRVSFSVPKAARVAAFLDTTSDDPGSATRVWTGDETAVQIGSQSLTWDGIVNGQPAPSGLYRLGIRARDAAGNIVERAVPLTVEDSGLPVASIVSARIGPAQIIRGGQVCLDVLVRNSGQTVLRTAGPEPGYTYSSQDTYSSIADHQFGEHAGYWRIGLNWSGSTDTAGATYPYRWGFGRDLQPGEEATVHGCVQVFNEQDRLVYFAGLVQENVAIHSAGSGLVRVEISS